MTRLIFVRHGESEANREGRFAGWSDVALTEKGHAQAEKTAEYLDRYPIDAAYASDLRRAYDTARHTTDRRAIPLVPEPAFREICAGRWENCRFVDLKHTFADDYAVWLADIGRARCTGGESFLELQARVAAGVAHILAAHEGQTVLVGTHATPIRALECLLRGIPAEDAHLVPWTSNASITVVEYEGGVGRILLRGYCEHQGNLQSELPKNV